VHVAKFRYSKVALASIAIGVAFTGIEVYGSVAYLLEQAQPSYLVLGGALTTAAAAALIPISERCWRDGRYLLAALLFAALVPALSVTVAAAIERTGGARDRVARDHQAEANAILLKKEAVADAKAVAAADEAAAKAECSTGRKGRCLGLEERADKSRQRLETARANLAQAGVASKDPMVGRLAAVLPWDEGTISLIQPLILPLTISGLGLLFIAAGARPPKPIEVKTRRGKRKRRPKPRQPSPAKVIPMRRRA
jgi:hypothetical protein